MSFFSFLSLKKLTYTKIPIHKVYSDTSTVPFHSYTMKQIHPQTPHNQIAYAVKSLSFSDFVSLSL